jgi:hypothetical protein
MHAVNLESSGKTSEDTKFDKMHLSKRQSFGTIVGAAVPTYYLPVPLTAVLLCSYLLLLANIYVMLILAFDTDTQCFSFCSIWTTAVISHIVMKRRLCKHYDCSSWLGYHHLLTVLTRGS